VDLLGNGQTPSTVSGGIGTLDVWISIIPKVKAPYITPAIQQVVLKG